MSHHQGVSRQTPKHRTVAWAKHDPFGVEFAEVTLAGSTLAATGVAIGSEPVPYRLDYRLETTDDFVTSQLEVESRGQGWRRSLNLTRNRRGLWTAEAKAEGELLPPLVASETAPLADARDCDLGLSPLTNSMPVLRHNLLHGNGAVDLVVAWISVPDLGVHAARQSYTFLGTEHDRHLICFQDDSGFSADIAFDPDCLVVDYPGLAKRL
jgi:hypothetical protein